MTKRETLYRASVELHTEGRTLTGLAMPWDTPTRVVDPGTFSAQRGYGGSYMEALAPGSADVTLRQHASFPTFVRHDYASDPLGVVTFQRSHEGLIFEAPISDTARGNDYLTLVNDGAMRSVSLGYLPIKHTLQRFAAGDTVYRTEIGIRELSLAPTGFGQYEGARVLAVRDSVMTDQTFDAITDAVTDAIVAKIGASDDGEEGKPYVYVRDISDGWAVYTVEGGPADVANAQRTLYKVNYTQADDGTISVDDPVAVQVAYVPTSASTERADLHADLVARRTRAERAMRSAVLGHAL